MQAKRIFWSIEAVLLVLMCWELFTNRPTVVFLVLGIVALVLAGKRIGQQKQGGFSTFLLVVGLVATLISLFTNIYIWLMILLALFWFVFAATKDGEATFQANRSPFGLRRAKFMQVQTEQPAIKGNTREQHLWFGNEVIGEEVFQWDDINLSCLYGDTIIDLGNTLLPKDDSVILITKGIGRTRVLVPVGTSLSIKHSAMFGSLVYNNANYMLRNESIHLYSPDYDTATRRLRIVTNVAVGDLEVIFV